jgi:hypothetical protein
MVLSNAQRQARFRERTAYLRTIQPRDFLTRACTASAIAALSFLLKGARPG